MITNTETYRRIVTHVLHIIDDVLDEHDASSDEGKAAMQLAEAKMWLRAALMPEAIHVDHKGVYVLLDDGSDVCVPWY